MLNPATYYHQDLGNHTDMGSSSGMKSKAPMVSYVSFSTPPVLRAASRRVPTVSTNEGWHLDKTERPDHT